MCSYCCADRATADCLFVLPLSHTRLHLPRLWSQPREDVQNDTLLVDVLLASGRGEESRRVLGEYPPTSLGGLLSIFASHANTPTFAEKCNFMLYLLMDVEDASPGHQQQQQQPNSSGQPSNLWLSFARRFGLSNGTVQLVRGLYLLDVRDTWPAFKPA